MRIALLALLIAFPLGCGTSRPHVPALDATGPDALATARDDYRAACAPCHGLGARGDGPVAPSLRPPPPDLATLAAHHGGTFPTAAVIATMNGERDVSAHGSRTMPIWADRFGAADAATAVASIDTRRRLEGVARYLATLQR